MFAAMAVKKKAPRKNKRKPSRSTKKQSLGRVLIKAGAGLTILALFVVACVFLARHYSAVTPPGRVVFNAVPDKQTPVPTKRANVRKAPLAKAKKQHVSPPTYEVYPGKEIPHYKPATGPRTPLPKKLPTVAIIIDDLGYDSSIAEQFIGLDATLTFSILPFSPFKEKIAGEAKTRGFDVLLHLPMEPLEYPKVNPGPGALLTAMSPDELIRQLNDNLDSIPYAVGVNNHMGSKMTAKSDRMNQVFSVLKQRKLFFHRQLDHR